MDSDESTGWPGDEGFPDGGDDLATPGDDELSVADLGYGDLNFEGTGEVAGSAGAEYGDSGYDGGYELEPEPAPGLADDIVDEDPVTDPDTADALPGTDPDADPLGDDESWGADPFPETLDLDQPPEPMDGMPWSDASLLGGPGVEPLGEAAAGGDGSPPVEELYAYHGGEPPTQGSDPWRALAESEDPATSSLARFWGPVS